MSDSKLIKISRSCCLTVSDDGVSIERSWAEFVDYPLMFLLIFTGFFALGTFYPPLKELMLSPRKETLFESSQYALFLVWLLFIPPIIIFYFSKTKVQITKDFFSSINFIVGIRFQNFRFTLRSVDSFSIESRSIRSAEEEAQVFQIHVQLINAEKFFVLKFIQKANAQQVLSLLQDFLIKNRCSL